MKFLLLLSLSFSIIAFAGAENLPRYDMDVRVDPATKSMTVQGKAIFPEEHSNRPKLTFILATQMKDPKFTINGAPATMESGKSEYGETSLTLTCPSDNAGKQIEVGFSYAGGSEAALVFNITPESTFASEVNLAWYPALQQGEHTLRNMVGTVRYSIPKDLVCFSSGAERSVADSGDLKVYDYKVDQPAAVSFAVAKYKVVRSPGSTPVSLYTLDHGSSDAGHEQLMIDGIRKVVDTLSSIYGRFPYPAFALVEVTDKAASQSGFGGASCPGFMLSTTSYLDEGFNMAFLGHEIGHQWWGNLITHEKEATGRDMLDEAMAQYGSLYCVRHLMGDATAERYRRDGFPGYVLTQCGGEYINKAAAGVDHRLLDLPSGDLISHELADEKGFLVYDELRRVIGDKAFHRALKIITSRHPFQAIYWNDFTKAVEESYGKNLGWFWKQWLERTGTPILSLKWTQNGRQVKGELLQDGDPYRLDVPIAVRYKNGSVRMQMIHTSEGSHPFSFDSEPVQAIEVDPHFEVLHSTPEGQKKAECLAPATRADWLRSKGDSKGLNAVLDELSKNLGEADNCGLQFWVRYRLGIRALTNKNYDEAIAQEKEALACASRIDKLLPYCYLMLHRAAEAKKDASGAKWAAQSLLICEEQLQQRTSFSIEAETWLKQHP